MVCTCKVFVCKRLPCSHILAARRLLQLPVLTEDLFENRFRLDYNPNFVGDLKNVTVTQHLPQTDRVLDKRQKWKLAKEWTDRIASKMCELGTAMFHRYLDKLKDFDGAISELRDIETEDEVSVSELGSVSEPEPVRMKESELASVSFESEPVSMMEAELVSVSEPESEPVNMMEAELASVSEFESELVSMMETELVSGSEPEPMNVTELEFVNVTESELVNMREHEPVSVNMTEPELMRESEEVVGEPGVQRGSSMLQDLATRIQSPTGIVRRGRPKGSGQTVLGGVRKRVTKGKKPLLNCNRQKTSKRVNEEVCTKCGRSDPRRKLSKGDTLWIMCDRCLNWYHQVCVEYAEGDFVCRDCKIH